MNFLSNIAIKLSSLELATSLPNKNFWEVLWQMIKDNFISKLSAVLELLSTIINTVCSWVMAVIDFLFVVLRQICGINTDFSSLESVAKDDIILQFLTSESIKNIVRNITLVAIALIIVFGIIAVIKSEYEAIKDTKSTGEIKNEKSGIIKNILESLLLIVLVPVVLIGGIILSNGVLQALYNVTAGGNNISIGTQIFVASSYDANKYRIYANNNKKIPITYTFNQISNYSAITDFDVSGKVSEISQAMAELKEASEWTQGYATFEQFYFNEFLDMDGVDELQKLYSVGNWDTETQTNPYNEVYDRGIRTNKYEYYVNADLVDYLMKTRLKIYLLTAQEVYDSCDRAARQTTITYNEETNSYNFAVNYNDGKDAIEYSSKENKYDEADGAVFIACVQDFYQDSAGTTQTYYRPIEQSSFGFTSTYLTGSNNLVVVRGIFDEEDYPTAIRKSNGAIIYYRDRLNVPTYSTLFPHISYELPEGVTEEGGTKVIKGAIQFFTGIDVNDFLPYLYFDIDLQHLFSKSEKRMVVSDGGYSLDYMFTAKDINIEHFYNKLRINIIILVLATILIGKKVLYAIFGALKRFVDIMLLYLLYPAAIATIPLFGKSSFGNWTKKTFNKVVSLYGLVLGINLGLLLVPISSNIVLFTPENLANTKFAWMGTISIGAINMLVQVLFTLVGIYFIFEIPKIVQKFVTPGEKQPEEIMSSGEKVVSETTKVYKNAAKVISGTTLVSSVKGLKNWIPGSAIVKNVSDNYKLGKFNRNQLSEKENNSRAEYEKQKQEALEKYKKKPEENQANSSAEAPANSSGGETPADGE